MIGDEGDGTGSNGSRNGGGGRRRRRPTTATLGSDSRQWASGADSRARVRDRSRRFGASRLGIQFRSRRVQSRVAHNMFLTLRSVCDYLASLVSSF
ncbi:hypothetical protein Hanom_Chr04g00298031 [Helianthus anomalus]